LACVQIRNMTLRSSGLPPPPPPSSPLAASPSSDRTLGHRPLTVSQQPHAPQLRLQPLWQPLWPPLWQQQLWQQQQQQQQFLETLQRLQREHAAQMQAAAPPAPPASAPAAPEQAAAAPAAAPGPAASAGPAAAAAALPNDVLLGVVGHSGWEVNADKDRKRGLRAFVPIQESRTAGQLGSQHGQYRWMKPRGNAVQWKKLAAAPGTPVTFRVSGGRVHSVRKR